MPILQGGSGVDVDNTHMNDAGRDVLNFAGPSNYHQQRGGQGTTIHAEQNDQVNLHTNVLSVDGNININYMEPNPRILQGLVNAFSALFSLFQASSGPRIPSRSEEGAVDATTHSVTSDLPMQSTANVETETSAVTDVGGEIIITSFPNYESGTFPLGTQTHFNRVPVSYKIYLQSIIPEVRRGFPLWLPQPAQGLPQEYQRKGISVGDVGVIMDGGGFDFLFNVLLSARDPINVPATLPNDFNSGLPPNPHTASQPSRNRGESPISSLHIEEELSSDENDLSFKCIDGNAGAVLFLPHGASETDLTNERKWKQFIFENALKWYRYARDNCGRDVDRHSLYFITGYMKSKSWGIATFNKSVPERNSLLILGESNNINRPSYIWKRSGGASSFRSGPSPDPASPRNDLESGLAPNLDENQCLFLRGFKISLSLEAWKELLDPISVKNTDDKEQNSEFPPENNRAQGNGSDTSKNITESVVSSSSGRGFEASISLTKFPSNDIASHLSYYVLPSQIPNSRIAVTHDNVWCTLFSKDKSPHGMEQLADVLKTDYVIGFNEELKGCTLEAIPISSVGFQRDSLNITNRTVPSTKGKGVQFDDKARKDHLSMFAQTKTHEDMADSDSDDSKSFTPLDSSDPLYYVHKTLVSMLCRKRTFSRFEGSDVRKILDVLQMFSEHPLIPLVDTSRFRRAILFIVNECYQYSNLQGIVDGDVCIENIYFTSGDFSTIYRGTLHEQLVCVKVMTTNLRQSGDEEGAFHLKNRLFRRESSILSLLSHPNILPFCGTYMWDGIPCIITPWMDHGTVMQYIESNTQVNRYQLILDVADGIHYLHNNEIIHGDIKGDNILVNDLGRACVADFNLSALTSHPYDMVDLLGRSLALRWQAPEILSADISEINVTKASDVYSFASTCVAIITGRDPYSEISNRIKLIAQICNGYKMNPLPAKPLGDEIADTFLRSLHWQNCWARDPFMRPSIDQVIERIKPYIPEDERPKSSAVDELHPSLSRLSRQLTSSEKADLIRDVENILKVEKNDHREGI